MTKREESKVWFSIYDNKWNYIESVKLTEQEVKEEYDGYKIIRSFYT